MHLQMTSKTVTKPVRSLAGNDNTFAHYKQSRGFDQISHALSNIHGLYGCSCNLFDVISVYRLNPGKLPGRFSYKRPGYEASKVQIENYTVLTTQAPMNTYLPDQLLDGAWLYFWRVCIPCMKYRQRSTTSRPYICRKIKKALLLNETCW